MTTEQRRALGGTIPTTEVIRDAVTFPRDRLGEPLDISPERFAAWLARVRRDAERAALDGLAEQERANYSRDTRIYTECLHAAVATEMYRDYHHPIPEETP